MSESVNPAPRPRPIVLCVLDGWGEREEADHNAIALGQTPHWDRLIASVPRARLDASAEQVGLPAGQMGNSEVGHMNLGAGRIVIQDLPRIDAAILSGELETNPGLLDFIAKLKQSGGLQIMSRSFDARTISRTINGPLPNMAKSPSGSLRLLTRSNREFKNSPLDQTPIARSRS